MSQKIKIAVREIDSWVISLIRPARFLVTMIAAGLIVAAGPVVLADITGSAHDFAGEGWNPTGEICVVCHTPHNSDTSEPAAPLWNHEVTIALYDVYSSPTMDVPVGQPGSASKLCLSCHDGTVALDSFGGVSGGTFIDPAMEIGTYLGDDHPIGIEWQHQTLYPQPLCGSCHSIHFPMDYYGPPFFDGKLECASCHDVHGQGPPEPGLLRKTMAGSELCFWCHGT